jgi:hypothetical protein
VKAFKLALMMGLILFAVVATARAEERRLVPMNSVQTGTVQNIDLVRKSIHIDGVKYQLSLDFKIQTGLISDPERPNKLQVGDRIGFVATYRTGAGEPAINAVWLLPDN